MKSENSSSNWQSFVSDLDTKQATTNPTMNIINFYKILFSEVSNINLNMDDVLATYKNEIETKKPSENASERIKDIYSYLRDLDKESIEELSGGISGMNKQNLFDTIQNIEKLYMKLMIEYNFELQRAQNLGLFFSRNSSESTRR